MKLTIEVKECPCGHLVKIFKPYSWNSCSKCGQTVRIENYGKEDK